MSEGKAKVEQRTECVYSKHSPLCLTMDKAGVPPDPRWRTAIMNLRGLEYLPWLTMKQRAESQALLMDLLRDKDFSDQRYEDLTKALDAVVTAPYREKLEEALKETTELIRDVEDVLGRRTGDVQELEEYAVETVRAGESPEKMVRKLRAAFHRVVKTMEEDASQLREIARTDSLTGLHNRRAFDEFMAALAERAGEQGLRPCLMMLDIDHFKVINDTYGHVIGDQALKVVAGKIGHSLKKHCGGEYHAFRYGGEEFTVVLPDMALDEAWDLAEAIRQTVERYRFTVRNASGDIMHKGIRFTVSIGLAQAKPDGRLVEAADAALYDAKITGRNRVSLFEGARRTSVSVKN